jgi:3-hydroxyisobutyrate dehydrogenase-like beta-hydroxyacid dehydrogenase
MEAAFLGLGAMGHAMAGRVLAAGHRLQVWNRSPEKARDLEAAGAQLAATPADAARAGVVLTSLADDEAVLAVVEGEAGILAGLPPGGLHVSLSTISYQLGDRLAKLHAEHGQAYVSAPVFGRPTAAQGGQLFVVAAGADEQLARADPLFQAISQRVFPLGERPAAANLVKLCGNFLILCVVEGLAETMTLAGKAGVEKAALLEVLTGTLFGAPIYHTYGEILTEGRYRPAGFRAPLGLKDMRLAAAAAEELRTPMPFLGVIRDHLLQTIALEGEDIDWSAMALAVERNAGR